MSHPPSALSRLAGVWPALERLAGAPLRVWRRDGSVTETLAGPAADWEPPLDGAPAPDGSGAGRAGRWVAGPAGVQTWFEPVPGVEGVWVEAGGESGAAALAQVVGAVLTQEREIAQVAQELSERYEEIDLIYSISEILGQTVRLDEAARRILQEVATVVRARRATLLVVDEERRVLRIAAARGMNPDEAEPIELDDALSVAARAFRERKIVGFDPRAPGGEHPGRPEGRRYRGRAFLSVPVTYAPPGGPALAVGVINLTDRMGEDAFSAGDRKLVAAIANQIGAAVANARLVQRDLAQQRVRRELELAHDLQLRLLPSPLVLAAQADVAVRCRPAESVGGDFYNLLPLRDGRFGVMLGDVSGHGFGAALIMALAMAASGIHAEWGGAPVAVLTRLEESLADELSRTEMFLNVFYAVLDPARSRLIYANAGHPHAFVVGTGTGEVTRLAATRAPLGLGSEGGEDRTEPWPKRERILCLFTDGIADAVSERGERFGEDRLLGHVARLRDRPMADVLDAIYTDLAAFTGGAYATDDRTLVLLRA